MAEASRKIEIIEKCSECGSKRLEQDHLHAEVVCGDCGLVMESNIIDQGAEWRAFDSEQKEKKARTGPSMTVMLHDKGLSTDIGWQNVDHAGKAIPSKNRYALYRMRKWQRRTRVSNATERNMVLALTELDRISSIMGLPRNVREVAAVTYKKAVEKRLIRGRSIKGVCAAALYAACRICDVPRTLDEVSEASRTGRKEIGRTFRYMVRQLKMQLKPTNAGDYLPRFCSDLGLDNEVMTKTMEIIDAAEAKGLTSGRGPIGLAAAATYIATVLTGKRRTQKEIAEVMGVTEVTIRNRYKELCANLGIEMPER